MNSVLSEMISRYQCETDEDYINAFKEIIQDIALLGLWRAKFFEHASFYGETALRILYQLNRFSEDLDFILLTKDDKFSLAPYQTALIKELNSFGLSVNMTEKKKTTQSSISSAFLKANTREHVIRVGAPKNVVASFQLEESIKIKLEIDTDPSPGFVCETRQLLYPVPFFVRTLSLPSLFAGKLHAVLCRGWGRRVKGRDWFDLIWFVQKKIPARLQFLEQKMRQTGHYDDNEPLTLEKLKLLLRDQIEKLDIDRAKDDVVRFIRDPRMIEGWTKEGSFLAAVEQIVGE